MAETEVTHRVGSVVTNSSGIPYENLRANEALGTFRRGEARIHLWRHPDSPSHLVVRSCVLISGDFGFQAPWEKVTVQNEFASHYRRQIVDNDWRDTA